MNASFTSPEASRHKASVDITGPEGAVSVQGSKRLPSLDGLRGFSIWAVLLAHMAQEAPSLQSPRGAKEFVVKFLAGASYFGVTVFFVISGFLITYLLLKERQKTATVSLSRFYYRRCIRILPAFLVYASIMLVLGHASLAQKVYAFTFTTSYFFEKAYKPLQQLWSLSVEEQFYLAWPLLMLWGRNNAKRSCWAVLLICPLIRLYLGHVAHAPFDHFAPAIMDSIAAGCLLALYYDRLKSFADRYLLTPWAFYGLCVGTLFFAEAIVYHFLLLAIWGVVPCLIALMTVAAVERRDPILNSRFLVWSGLLSYSVYLWQQPFMIYKGALHPLVRLLLAFIVGYVSYRFVEQPVLEWLSPAARNVPKLPISPAAMRESS